MSDDYNHSTTTTNWFMHINFSFFSWANYFQISNFLQFICKFFVGGTVCLKGVYNWKINIRIERPLYVLQT